MTDFIPTRLEGSSLAVATHELTKSFGETVALAGANLTVPEGAFYLLIGPNGAGKSTLLKILLDLVRADAGTAQILGMDTTSSPLVRGQIGYVPEHRLEAYGWMRVGGVIAHHAAYYPTWDAAYADRLVKALDIDPRARLEKISKGQARRVELVLALAHRPPVLLLDEPTDGLDPLARDRLLGLLAEHLADSPTTVLASTHLVQELDRLADHVGVLRDGRLAAQLARADLERRMRSYTLDVPADVPFGSRLDGVLYRRNGRIGHARWTVWGDETAVRTRLSAAGAVIREVEPVTLQDAAVALLSSED